MRWGSILKLVGKGALAFGTGGASLAAPGVGAGSMMGDLSDVLGGAAKAGAENNLSRDKNTLTREAIRLGRDKFAVDAPGTRMQTSLKAALQKNATPASVQWGGPGSGLRGEIPQFNGGIKSIYAGMQDPTHKKLLDQVMADELMQQQQGGVSGKGLDTAMPEINKTSLMDKILGGAAMGTSILGAIMKNRGGGGMTNDSSTGIYS